MQFTPGAVRGPPPLVRSGLVLAGANRAASTPGGDDGILTALELSGLDLHGTELVVLSACETGVGTTPAGQAVQGFRAALALAGADTQILSLWDVDDEATAVLMGELYARLDAGESAVDALAHARQVVAARPEWSHPAYWAAFQLYGRTGAGPP